MNNIVGFLNNQEHTQETFAAMFDGVFGNIRNINIKFENNGGNNYLGLIKFPDKMGLLHNGYFIIINGLDTDYPNGLEVNVGDVIIARINKTDYTGSIVVYDESTVIQDTSDHFMIELGKIIVNKNTGTASFEEVENESLGSKERLDEYLVGSYYSNAPVINTFLPLSFVAAQTFSGKASEARDDKVYINHKATGGISIGVPRVQLSTSYSPTLNTPIEFSITLTCGYKDGNVNEISGVSVTRYYVNNTGAVVDDIAYPQRFYVDSEGLEYVSAILTIRNAGTKPSVGPRFDAMIELEIKELV